MAVLAWRQLLVTLNTHNMATVITNPNGTIERGPGGDALAPSTNPATLAGTMTTPVVATATNRPYTSAVVTPAPAIQQTNNNMATLDQIRQQAQKASDDLALLKLKGYTDTNQVPKGVDIKDLPNYKAQSTPTNNATDTAIGQLSQKEAREQARQAGESTFVGWDGRTYNTADNAPISAPTPESKNQELRDGFNSYASQLDSLGARMDARSQDIINGIKAEYDGLVKEQELANKAYEGGVTVEGMVSGRARYAPNIAMGDIQAAVSTGISKISALQAKKQSLIAEAEMARDEKNFTLLDKKMSAYRDLIKEERAAAQETFENTMKLSQEARQQAQEERNLAKDQIDQSATIAEGVASNYDFMVANQGQEAADAYIGEVADNLGLPRAYLASNVQKTLVSRRATEKTSVLDLGKKYPDAGIKASDTFEEASAKVRGSHSYALDIGKSELDLANTSSIISNRKADSNINYADPIFKIYSDATGQLISSPTTARSVQGYAQSLLAGKEIVADDATNVSDNQIKASDAQKLLTDSFANFKGTKVVDSEIWQWLAQPDVVAMDDSEKAQYIRSQGKNPEDFGVWD